MQKAKNYAQPKPFSVCLIGAGNVATHLGKVIVDSGHQIVEIVSKSEEKLKRLADSLQIKNFHSDLSKIRTDAEIYIIAVQDDAIQEVVDQLPLLNGIVVHTSGTYSGKEALRKFNKWGVFYPLQTFSLNRKIDFTDLPFLITCEDPAVFKSLSLLAKSFQSKAYKIEDSQRIYIHISAVFINNFTNHLLSISEEFLKEHSLNEKLFYPLVKETVLKSIEMGAYPAQTGPAMRNDAKTIQKHIEILAKEENPMFLEIYELFTKSIFRVYQNTNSTD